MTSDSGRNEMDDTIAEDVFTDTSIFSAEEIVRQLEQSATNSASNESPIDARRKREIYMEKKRLLEELSEYEYDDLLNS